MVHIRAGNLNQVLFMYYNYDKLISYNALLNFVIGERGVGKTFNAKVFVIKDFIRNGNQFVYLRRYKTELASSVSNFFDDLQANDVFDDLCFTIKKEKGITKFLCDGEVIGYAVPLSNSNILKSTAFPKVKTIIYDEFILDVGTYRYLTNEVTKMLDLIETIGRLRDIRVMFLGNSISIDNPYFNYFNLTLPYNSEFKTFKDGMIVVNYIKNLEYRAEKRKSRFGKLIDGTDYGSYAIDNKMLRDDNSFIGKKGKNPQFYNILVINGKKYGVWKSTENGNICVSEDFDPSCKIIYAFTISDHSSETRFISIRKNPYMKILIEAFRNGELCFESQRIKNEVFHIIRKCLSY